MTALGIQPREIAALLGVAASTVRNHLAELRSELGVKTTLQAFVYAQFAGWIDLEDINAMRTRIDRWREHSRDK